MKALSIWEKTTECGGQDQPVAHIALISSFTWAMSLVILLISHKRISEFLQGKMTNVALFLYPLDEHFPLKKVSRFFLHTLLLSNFSGCFLLISLSSRFYRLFHNSFRACFFFPSTAHCAHFFHPKLHFLYTVYYSSVPKDLTCPPSFFKSN